ncbi:hypothetical protein [Bacillus cereus group sp. BY105LC]|uniref:hypothetical protein n=1 Tax=Bacillus cereus group sp. BY105LC TaxID=3018088 RepID=UPI0022E4B0E7|nr:hypothetical protein [Bacillus cereus group sp. BY105LC]MDA1883093.1 hypothetical protein [Bacillus cereus group sp. BY105LC]
MAVVNINQVENSVQAMMFAKDTGILDIYYENQVQVTHSLLEKLLNEKGSLEIVKRNCSTFPVQVEFTKNGFTYFAIYTAKYFENTFGGNIDECITTK